MRIAAAIVLGLVLPLAAAELPAPSANAGKRGKYHVTDAETGYDYWVCVPQSYRDDSAAGIHIFFHGQGGQGGAPHFDRWARYFLEPYTLIGINMQYQDGDNAKDTQGKIRAAKNAVAQVTADYRVVKRGVISSFSGGGLPHGGYYGQEAVAAGTLWPFNHVGLYGSNYRVGVVENPRMSWCVAVGQNEWRMASLGTDACARMDELLGHAKRGGVPDHYLKIIPGKGHTIEDADAAESARGFRRSDLAFGAFVYLADFTDAKAQRLAAAAEAGALGRAGAEIAKALERADEGPAREQLQRLQRLIDARVEAIIACCTELAREDLYLFAFYGKRFRAMLKGHARADELEALIKDAGRSAQMRAHVQAAAAFAEAFPGFFGAGGASLRDREKNEPLLQQILDAAGAKSQSGGMAGEFLKL